MSFFSWVKESFAHSLRTDKLYPECRTNVEFDAQGVQTDCSSSKLSLLKWNDISGILIQNTSGGPWAPDIWWILARRDGAILCFPQGANGENALISELQRRFPTMEIRGMNSTKDEVHLIWGQAPKNFCTSEQDLSH